MRAFRFRPRHDGSTLVSWNLPDAAGHILIRSREEAEHLASLNLPGAIPDALEAYLEWLNGKPMTGRVQGVTYDA